ncbi:hypothetical protein MtrunA17_Chr1g0190871 [Medicago truncatula]|uniref:Uncharacterized protein n=1 Tax=Medicago truncatula TaxID=3880 RepID=A0A396JQY7_MEDTR|nr:hypothetical protein MtrunA17_Chr1g0190871 [Medicago truncatula]
MTDINFFTDVQLGTETGKVINGATFKHMKLIPAEVYKQLSTDMKDSDAVSTLMKNFPPICKQDPLDVQMNFIKDHFATTGIKLRLEDVPETMYGGALPVAKCRKTKRKALTNDEYLDDASEQPTKKSKKAEKEKTSVKMNEAKKDAEVATSLQKTMEIAREIEVPASSIVREDVGADAQEVVKATEEVQEMVTSEAGSLLMVVAEGVHEDNVGCSEAGILEASRDNHDSPHSVDVINIESSSTSVSLSQPLYHPPQPHMAMMIYL